MDRLARLIEASEGRLMKILLGYALKTGYTRYSSTLEEAWRMSVSMLSKTLIDACATWDGPPELGPDDDYLLDPIAGFGIAEAQKHRARGIRIDMFLGLMKYYRQSYRDVIGEAGFEQGYEQTCRLFVDRVYDRIELGFCKEWCTADQSRLIEELQADNRFTTTEKNKFLTVYESLPNPVILINTEFRIENMNNATMRFLQISNVPGFHYYQSPAGAAAGQGHPEPASGRALGDLFPWLAEDVHAFASGDARSHRVEKAMLTGTAQLHFQVEMARMLDISRKFAGMIIVLVDITERRRAEMARRKSEKRYRQLFESMISGFALHELIRDADGRPCDYRFLEVNPAFERLTGLKAEDLIGRTVLDVLPGTEDFWIETYARVATSGESLHFENYSKALDKSYSVTAYATEPDRFVTLFHDITERKRAEEALSAEKELLSVTLASIGDGVITTDVSGRILSLNRVAEELTGWLHDEALGRELYEVFCIINEHTRIPCEHPVDKVIKSGSIIGLANNTVLIRRGGGEIIIDDSGAPIRDRQGRIIGVVLVFRDITEKERTQQALQNARKLESVGELAGGIAHDFNNLLGGVFGYLDLARVQANTMGATSIAVTLSKAIDVFDQAKYLTQQLLTFSKGGTPIRKTQSLIHCLKKSVVFSLSGAKISPVFNIPGDIWLSDFDEHQLQQVFDNITINARQAMPKGGKLEVTARNIPLRERPGVLPPADYIHVSIRDHGTGIRKEHLPRIFDPFFTTKQQGSGLGLATCYSIIKKHDGMIEVESDVDQGTTFHVYLPASSSWAAEKETAVIQRGHRGCGRILVMDDERYILDVVALTLERMGYEVTTAECGDRAVEQVRSAIESRQPFDAAILDLTIPGGRGGQETVGELREMDPHLKVIASSGYSEDPVMANPSDYGFAACLAKPYRRDDLIKVLELIRD